jgi:hypothetical protein
MKQDSIIILLGRICSGKSSYKPDSGYRIVVSNIVRDLIQSQERSALQDTLHLSDRIGEEIISCLDALTTAIKYKLIEDHTIIVDGIRQSSIIDQILQYYPHSSLVWLDVPFEERKRRYNARNAEKDTENFEVADNKAIELECQKIYSIFKEQIKVINN